MKKVLSIAVLFLLVGVWPVFAHSSSVSTKDNVKNLDDYVVGAKFDAPNIIRLTENLTVGAEVLKDLRYTNSEEGWAAYGKVVWSGSLINFSKN